MTRRPDWTQVAVQVPAADAELAADRLWAFGPAAIEERTTTGGTLLVAGFDDPRRADEAAGAFEHAGLGIAETRPVGDGGLDAWREWARIEHAPPFVIVPTWLAPPPALPGQRVLRIDPHHSFGSGSHPSTRLVLGRIAELVAPGDRVLDVGCGSGILSVAAALRGARLVRGIDVDPDAPATTHANARANAVAHRVTASLTPLAELVPHADRYEVVVANLLASVVEDLADPLLRVLAPGGALVVSGLLADRWRATTERLRGLDVVHVATETGWAAITLVRAGGSDRSTGAATRPGPAQAPRLPGPVVS